MRPLPIGICGALLACGGVSVVVIGGDGSTDSDAATEASVRDGAIDVIDEWRRCTPTEASLSGDEAGVGGYLSCCDGYTCKGSCNRSDAGATICSCGGILGGCDPGPDFCCGDRFADVLLFTCGNTCAPPGN